MHNSFFDGNVVYLAATGRAPVLNNHHQIHLYNLYSTYASYTNNFLGTNRYYDELLFPSDPNIINVLIALRSELRDYNGPLYGNGLGQNLGLATLFQKPEMIFEQRDSLAEYINAYRRNKHKNNFWRFEDDNYIQTKLLLYGVSL